jgi:hypothetical protein
LRADVFPRSRKRRGLHRTDSTRRSSSSTIAAVSPVVLTRTRRATSHESPLLYVAILPGRDSPQALARLRCCECTIPPVGYIHEAAHRSGGGLRPPNPFSHRTIFSESWDDPGTAPDRPRQRLQAREGRHTGRDRNVPRLVGPPKLVADTGHPPAEAGFPVIIR